MFEEHHREKLYFIYPENMKIYRSTIRSKYIYTQIGRSPFNIIMAFIYTYRSYDLSNINIKKFLLEYKNSIGKYGYSNMFPEELDSYIFRSTDHYPVPLLIVNKQVEPLQKLLNILYEILYTYRTEFEALRDYNRTVLTYGDNWEDIINRSRKYFIKKLFK